LKKKSRENDAPIWGYIASCLAASRSRRPAVNLDRISRNARLGEVVVVPGKVLGGGIIREKITVAAFKFSSLARQRIEEAGGRCLRIEDLVMENPTGAGVKVMR